MRRAHGTPFKITPIALALVAACADPAAKDTSHGSAAAPLDSGQHAAGSQAAAGSGAHSSQDAGGLDASREDAQDHKGDASTEAGVVGSVAPPTARGVIAARSARDFLDSVGVNTHLSYTNRNYWDFPQLASTLSELGVAHIRDGQPPAESYLNEQSTAGIVTARLQLLAAAGVKATLISGYASDPAEAADFATQQLEVFKHLSAGIAAFEHTNEPDLFAARDDDQWAEHLRAYLPALWQARNADPATAALPVLAPSVVNEFAAFAQAFPTQHEVITHCNVHPYPGGAPPESNLLRALGACRAFIGEVPVVATETGYHTAINDTSGHHGVSDAAQGIYMPRLFLEYFQRGVARTHSYELLDEYADPLDAQREAQFGLVRLDWSRKPAFIALARLLSLLDDPGPAFSASGLELHASDRDVRVVVLQKSDGTFWIVLWRPVSVFDLATNADIGVAATPVTLTFGAAPSRVIQHALRDPQSEHRRHVERCRIDRRCRRRSRAARGRRPARTHAAPEARRPLRRPPRGEQQQWRGDRD